MNKKRTYNFVFGLILSLFVAIALLPLGACSTGIAGKQEYPKGRYDRERAQNGSVFDDDSGISLWNSKDKRKNAGDAGFGANGYLWRATLDTIGFMPLASADRNGGVVVTDWYSPAGNTAERVKLNIVIKDQTLRADGVKVTVFRQTREDSKQGTIWVDAAPNPTTATQLEETILQRARQLKQADKGKDDEEN